MTTQSDTSKSRTLFDTILSNKIHASADCIRSTGGPAYRVRSHQVPLDRRFSDRELCSKCCEDVPR